MLSRIFGNGNKTASFLLVACMFATGASGLVVEYILSTVSTYILGNSIEQFSMIIALMLLMMGVAGWVQKFVSESALVDKFITVEICLAVLGSFAPIGLYAVYSLMDSHYVLFQYLTVSAIGFLIGFEIPLVLRLNRIYSQEFKVNVGNVFSADYIGSFVGATVWTFFLLRTFPLTEISFLVAGSNFAIALVTGIYFLRRGLVKRPRLMSTAMAATVVLLVFGYVYNRDWNMQLEQRLYDDKIVLAETTKYQRIVVTRNAKSDEYRLYINGNLQFSSVDEAIYHEQLVHPAMAAAKNPRHVLILGGGDGLALREVLKYPGLSSVTLVDLDPEMTKLFSTDPILVKFNQGSLTHAKVRQLTPAAVSSDGIRDLWQATDVTLADGQEEKTLIGWAEVINVDADRFLDEVKQLWDVVIVDLPDPNSIELAKLYSFEFYSKLRNVLDPDGVVVVQATSPYHAKEAYLCIKRTMEAAGLITMPYHDNVPSFGDWGWLMARRADRHEYVIEPDTSLQFTVATNYLTPQVFSAAQVFGKQSLVSSNMEINTLMRPRLLDIYERECWLIE